MSDDDRPDVTEEPREDEQEAGPPPEETPDRIEEELVASASSFESIATIGPPGWPDAASEDASVEPTGISIAPPADPMTPVLEAIAGLGDLLGGRLDRLQAQFDRELRAESTREKVVDRLHAELQEYKNDLLLKVTKPIFLDLIVLHDDMGKMADSVGDDRAAGLLRDFQRGVEDVLYRQGVEPFRVDGETFDPRRQRAISTVSTEDPARNKTIAARLRPGFASGDLVIRPELVSVFALRKAPATGEQSGAQEP
ncbi:nucleotide exchange factor GrpE [Tautonia sociabilis]|uniref:Nucleotide exchange factor GrpE n=1 Tax=Tautonia sociabilis TaxID=2080755 RepID=A0A432MMC7_9BACT|nr:nucleotide exchange factor GrpE [Tautonia sociabilis]RUL88337.1 nucleotide exchange factor GrpE [Tautonia sociabilis]